MCGILGVINKNKFNLTTDNFRQSLSLLSHRGPDGVDIFSDKNILLGHHRLSIIDLDVRASQPMQYGKLIITFNGEIYNYKQIKHELTLKGYKFKSSSDTEVLILAWYEWKEKCLQKLEGMFAFAIWDFEDEKLFMARDRSGEKPIFWIFDNNSLIFSSELPPILKLLKKRPEIDKESFNLFFKLSYIPAPKTIYKNINQLEQGTYITFQNNKIVKTQYFDMRKFDIRHKKQLTYPQAISKLRRILSESVKNRLETADVPVATFLSGGLDSSIITYLASKNNIKKNITAYTLGFPEDLEYDETSYSRDFVKNLSNINHKIIPITEKNILDSIPKALKKLGEPFADASYIPTNFLCSQIEEKVVLSGDGADEIFAGYGVYSAINMNLKLPAILKSIFNILPKPQNPIEISNPFLRGLGLFRKNFDRDNVVNYINWRSYSSSKTLGRMCIDNDQLNSLIKEKFIHSFENLSELLKIDFKFNLPNDMLKKVDYASMLNSIEVRLPFLDTNLITFATNLPELFLIKNGIRKRILRDAFRDILDNDLLNRRKQGFLLPIRKWLISGGLRDDFEKIVLKESDFDTNLVKSLLKEHQKKICDHSITLWSMYVYSIWKKNHFTDLNA